MSFPRAGALTALLALATLVAGPLAAAEDGATASGEQIATAGNGKRLMHPALEAGGLRRTSDDDVMQCLSDGAGWLRTEITEVRALLLLLL